MVGTRDGVCAGRKPQRGRRPALSGVPFKRLAYQVRLPALAIPNPGSIAPHEAMGFESNGLPRPRFQTRSVTGRGLTLKRAAPKEHLGIQNLLGAYFLEVILVERRMLFQPCVRPSFSTC